MIHLKLENDEIIVLTNMIEECIIKVHREIAMNERADYRQMLKTRQKLLVKILKEISAAEKTPLAA